MSCGRCRPGCWTRTSRDPEMRRGSDRAVRPPQKSAESLLRVRAHRAWGCQSSPACCSLCREGKTSEGVTPFRASPGGAPTRMAGLAPPRTSSSILQYRRPLPAVKRPSPEPYIAARRALGRCREAFSAALGGSQKAGMPSLEFLVRCADTHWITWSARMRTDGGIVSPRVLAVFMLITSSKRVGCSTGRSAGLAPLKILST